MQLMLIVDMSGPAARKTWAAPDGSEAKPSKLCVTHYADDPECSGILRQINAEMLVQRCLH